MKLPYLWPLFRLVGLGLLLALVFSAPARAQPEAYNWHFGNRASIQFSAGGGPAVSTAAGSMAAYEGCASISDANGVLQCYTSGIQVWNRMGQVMPNGQLQGSDLSATQAALLLRGPGQSRYYYIFNLGAVDTPTFGVLRQSVVDMSLRGGLGDVTTNSVPVAVPGGQLITEKLTAVLHANGRDYWIIVHGWQNNSFYAYLLSPAGRAATPVVSAVGAVHSGDGVGGSNSIGYLRASPNGRLLAAAQVSTGIELFDFDPATGRVSAPRAIPRATNLFYGLEFSPDNSKLYVTNGTFAYQINLAANFAATELPLLNGNAMGLQRGPDGRIYLSAFGAVHLAVIHQPNAAGAACNLQAMALPLTGGVGQLGLPNFPNAFESNPVLLPTPVINALATTCEGNLLAVSTATPPPPGAEFSWNFGDPASGAANTATGPSATHRYASGGSYFITLTLTSGTTYTTTTQTAVISSAPRFSLGARQQTLCPGQTLQLSIPAQPAGTTYRWQDGTTTAAYVVRAPGRYGLRVTSPQGCVGRDSVEVLALSRPVVQLGRDTTLPCEPTQPLTLQANPQPPGSTFRWQDGSTAASYRASRPGLYWLEVRSPAGCSARDTVLVRAATGCPVVVVPEVVIPNVITPDGDPHNEFFVLQGLRSADWTLTLFNRWGRRIFQQEHYDNRWNAHEQPAGLYYYLLQHSTTGQQYRGWLDVVK